MHNKIEACKTCNGTGIEYDGAGHTCTECNGIAAPVIERQQPFAWFTDDYLTDKSSTTYDELTSARWKAKGWSVQPLYVAPPELAELQATIAALEAENKRLKLVEEAWKLQKDMPAAMVEALDEIERLKAGQGGPVAVVTSVISRKNKLFEIDILNNSSLTIGDKLYTSQPAPVSSEALQLLERAKVYARGPFLDEINVCLDKVKELNQ